LYTSRHLFSGSEWIFFAGYPAAAGSTSACFCGAVCAAGGKVETFTLQGYYLTFHRVKSDTFNANSVKERCNVLSFTENAS